MKALSHCILSAWLCIVGLGLAVSARAQESTEAKAYYRAGVALYKKGSYAGALAKFLAARKLYASCRIDFNIASTLQMMGETARAADYYQRVLAAGEAKTEKFTALSRERLDQLRPTLAKLVLHCPTAAEILINGVSRGELPGGSSIYAAPGAVAIVVRRAGQAPFTTRLQVKAGEEKQVLVPLFSGPTGTKGTQGTPAGGPPTAEGAPSTPPSGTGSSAALAAAAVMQETGLSQQAATRHRRTIWAYTTLGLGAALVATAGVFYALGGIQGSDAYDRHKADRSDEDARHDVKAARTKIVVADVLAGAGVAALGTSIYLFVTRPPRTNEARAARGGAGSLAIVPGALGATLVGRF